MNILFKMYIILIVLFSVSLIAQENDFNLEDLKAPSMPSATIIGTQINDINIPKSLKDLETAVFSNYLNSGDNLTVPSNYALEINPYMLGRRENFKYESYMENIPLTNMWRNLSISVASTNNFIINDTISSNAMGFSLRTIILNGEPKDLVKSIFIRNLESLSYMQLTQSKTGNYIDNYITKLDSADTLDYNSLKESVIKEFKENELTDNKQIPLSGDKLTKRKILLDYAIEMINSVFSNIPITTNRDTIEDKYNELFDAEVSLPSLEKLIKSLAKVKTDRFGFRWDLNWALALNFPTDEISYSVVPRWGVWTNFSYKFEEFLESFTFIGLGRILINNDNYINKYQPVDGNFTLGNHYDFGAKVIYESERFSLAFEYIYRVNTTDNTMIIDGEEYKRASDKSSKYIVNLNYNLSDDINLSYNFGKNFDSISPTQGDLISGLSINFGFGSIKASDIVDSKE